MQTVIRSKYGDIQDVVEQSKETPCVSYLVYGENIRYFEPPKKAGEITCELCGLNQMITCLDFEQMKGQPPRKLALCANPLCESLKLAREYQIPVKEVPIFWGKFGVPETHKNCTFANFNEIASKKERAEGFPQNDKWCFTLHGAAGKGKTHLAIALLKKFHHLKKEVAVFANTTKILQELREAQSMNENEYRVINTYVERPFLVMDDLGSTRGTDWQVEKLYEILDGRYAQRRKTVVTTNLTFDEIEKIFGARMLRRLSDNGMSMQFSNK